ncbi:MAG: hypothetical protein KA314_04575 [Chloroflexi bacterium]|nr:hypothetical protein [Chloroflexota bacterium]
MKQQPLGVCDNCLSEILPDEWYTSKGKPRRYCGRDCRNTGNSRAGSPIRSAKARQRVGRGEWQNPAKLNPPTPTEQSHRARLGRKREVKAGTWRNPALTDEAKEKLSRPRKHGPALHAVLEKLQQGQRLADLTPEEQELHRAYRRELRQTRREEVNTWHRNQYRQQQANMSDEEREAQRAKWREQNRRRTKPKSVK